VTLIDPWPENVEAIRARGLELDGLTPEEKFTVKGLKILHLTEVQSLAKRPVDVAMVAMKSYDTAWATHLILPYLSAEGFVVSLQNCLNEETIAGIVGWGRTVGVVASQISVDLFEAGRIRRTVAKGGDKYTIFRIGEPHGRITSRVEELVSWFAKIDSAKATSNLWGERWTKLVQNGMGNGVSAATGLTSGDCLRNPAIRRFQLRLAGESDPRRPGARLPAGESARPRCRAARQSQRRRRGGAGRSRSGAGFRRRVRIRAATSSARRWRRTSSKAGAPRSTR